MKKFLAIFSFCSLVTVSGFSQSKGYWSSGGEMLFSFADINDQGVDESSTLRWAPVVNLQGRYNYDLNENIGIFTGLGLHNVGYIYENYQDVKDILAEAKAKKFAELKKRKNVKSVDEKSLSVTAEF